MQSLDHRILSIVARVAERDLSEIRPEHELTGDLSFDSVKALELFCDVEEELGVELPDNAITDVVTVADILEIARSFTGEGHPASTPPVSPPAAPSPGAG